MSESRIKAENYITIQGWMVTELGLSGNALLLYALIYGFSQDGKSGFSGRQDYLMEWLHCTRQSITNLMNKLTCLGLIRKARTTTGEIVYQAVRCKIILHDVKKVDMECQKTLRGDVKKVDMECQKTLRGDVKKVDMECQKTLHLPINNNIDNTLYIDSSSVDIDTPVEQAPTPPTVEEIADYCRERGNGIDPQRFHDFYSLRKWQGREGSIAAPEQWQAIIRLWETNGRDGKKKDKQTEYHGGSFDTDQFFEASLRRSYGDEIAEESIRRMKNG